MIFRIAPLAAVLMLFNLVIAEVAPDITTLIEGYSMLVKLPCIGCPFLYQDTSKGEEARWTERTDNNALLLNITLPYTSPHLTINTAPLLPASKIPPKIYLPQVLHDISPQDLTPLLLSSNAHLAASYAYTLHRLPNPAALLIHFQIMQLWTEVTSPPTTIVLDDPHQPVLELVLLRRPLLGAADPGSAYEIVRAALVPRDWSPFVTDPHPLTTSMWFRDWDKHGKKGTVRHVFNSASERFVAFVGSGVWALGVFVVVVLALFCVVGLGGRDDYVVAQQGKRRKGGGGSADLEAVGGRRFLGPEELGVRGGGRVVGVGKSD
ncbi:hypothetical protein BDW02DRAFT_557512 [Decorospora gaudefroyi]|uniref:Uncharacterized protein n=1 Tax=Decorospora gaudefroyi TaxID=184978 RepID=A0A6A5K4Y1_9PLEO|nr:hypothetical protein BDW02DRAFT_557512 [Decorospora gaudefroyi]